MTCDISIANTYLIYNYLIESSISFYKTSTTVKPLI